MIARIKDSYQEAVSIGMELDREKSNLLETNRKLNQEIDIRQQVEDNLRESREHLKAIWDSISAGIVVIDVESHNIVDANPSALSMIGASRENVLNNICHSFICPAELGKCPVTDKEEKVDKSERALLTTTGEQVPILKTVTEIGVKGKTHLLETFIDITQLKVVEQKLKAACELAESSNRAKSDFLANMSHELRTPLNHIIGFTEMVLDNHFGRLNAIQAKYLNNVLQSGRHLLSLVNDILDLSKVEAGKMELAPTRVNLKQLMQNGLIMVKEKAHKNGIQLSLDTDGIPDTITADERKLKQVFYNLLANAVKFTPDRGRVSCTARQSETKGCIEISVADTGIGIRPADLTRIFDPFEQSDGSVNRQYKGTGLGLSLTKKFVELHGGKIWAESDGEGKGSRFRFTLPILAN
jgi:PAS domain S-box-containing protein